MYAISNQSIQGWLPQLSTDLGYGADKLGFNVEGQGNFDGLSLLPKFPSSLKYKDFKALVNRAWELADVNDIDGDQFATITASGLYLEWLDSNGNKLDSTITQDDNFVLDCSNSQKAVPSQLRVIANKIDIKTIYGDPSSNELTKVAKIYDLIFDEVCYISPKQLDMYLKAYKPEFITTPELLAKPIATGLGFTPYGSKKFPTTAFPGAEFTVTMKYNQTSYSNWAIRPEGTGVTINSSGKVSFSTQKPNQGSDYTVSAQRNGQTFSYTFRLASTRSWFVPDPNNQGVLWAKALTSCQGSSSLPTRSELTNSSAVGSPSASWVPGGSDYQKRAIGEGLVPEWGWLGGAVFNGPDLWYPKSTWINQWYWTSDYFQVRKQGFVARVSSGQIEVITLPNEIIPTLPTTKFPVICVQ